MPAEKKLYNRYAQGAAIRDLYDFFLAEFCDVTVKLPKIKFAGRKQTKAEDPVIPDLCFGKISQTLAPFMRVCLRRTLASSAQNQNRPVISSWAQIS